ncbi:MAG: CCA tRNA nucleotidyltransferase, partial [Hyphomicrobiales bacterium]|nr:CCA tRNA nucleotidyltransferase [Hyphomicrobiales bacterium]
PDEVIKRAKAAGLKTAPTGIDHGTVTVIADGTPFEVTTLRADVETDGRRAVVAFTGDWLEDARRRDFTINALYCDGEGTIFDPLGGLPDVTARRVRFIGNADERICEDYLRILRFFRFFAWYGHGRPDPGGLKAVARLKDGLAGLSAERVWAEIKRLLAAPDPGRALLWMRTTEIFQRVMPESWGIDAIHRLMAAERTEGWPADPLMRLEALLPPEPGKVKALAKRLKLSKAEAKRLNAWAKAPDADAELAEIALGAILYWHGVQAVRDRLVHVFAREAEAGRRADAAALRRQIAFADDWQKPVFPLKGEDLLAAGMKAGPAVGKRLRALEGAWVDGGFAGDREALLAQIADKH